MFKLNLSDLETQLMKRVCELQLDSLGRILNGTHDIDLEQKLTEHKVSEKELIEMITEVARQYREILDEPKDLFVNHTDLLNNFREALDFNTNQLEDFQGIISPMLNKLDLAIFIVQSRN
jgi:hypothetical protein